MRATVTALLLVLALVVTACTLGDSSEPVPSIDSATAADLQAQAFMRACRDVICAGAPIYAPDSTSDSVRQAIATYTDEVEYLNSSQVEALDTPEGRFGDGGSLFVVEAVRSTERDDVKAVDVSISRGLRDSVGRTYLFLWDGDQWVETSADAVNVTVTSSVS